MVTRTAPAQVLAQLTALPGVGLADIKQQLEAPEAGECAGTGSVRARVAVRFEYCMHSCWRAANPLPRPRPHYPKAQPLTSQPARA